ncbi:MAG: hypothetical protein O2816_01285 [Planctomycetota bacterium]|nr:hypothetical protein [Planctomycetota bacterium]
MALRDTTLARLQALSGLAFGTFLALHLASALAALGGPGGYDGALGAFRLYYQFPIVEIVMVAGAAVVHATCGVLRWRHRRALDRERGHVGRAPRWLVWHRRSGWFLLAILVGHVLATRGPSLLLGTEVEASYLGFSLATWPWMFYPYYLALFVGGLYHLTQGASAALRQLGLRTPYGIGTARPRAGIGVFVVAGVLGLVAILGLGGALDHRDLSRDDDWRALFEEYLPWMVTWDSHH